MYPVLRQQETDIEPQIFSQTLHLVTQQPPPRTTTKQQGIVWTQRPQLNLHQQGG